MSRRFLVLAVEIPDGLDLDDLGAGIQASLVRAQDDARESGRVRVAQSSEALGGWDLVDVDESASGEHGWTSERLIDRVTAVRLPNGAVQVVSEGGADPDDDEATPDECFADVVLSAAEARPIALSLAAWSLR